MTRWSIWPSVSRVWSFSPRQPSRAARVPLATSRRLAELEGVVVGDDDLGAVDVGQHVGGTISRCGNSFGVVGQQHAQAVADGDAGGDDQKAAGERLAVRDGGRR